MPKSIKDQIADELQAMKDIDMAVPDNVFAILNEYDVESIGGMTVSEMADYMIMLALND